MGDDDEDLGDEALLGELDRMAETQMDPLERGKELKETAASLQSEMKSLHASGKKKEAL